MKNAFYGAIIFLLTFIIAALFLLSSMYEDYMGEIERRVSHIENRIKVQDELIEHIKSKMEYDTVGANVYIPHYNIGDNQIIR